MLVLQTLGVAAIRVGTRTVLPSAARAFAALLYLGLERDRRIPRAELQAFIFPGQDERAASHGLRQLLYRLRALGAPIEAGPDSVRIPATAVEDDYSALGADPALASEKVRAVSAGVLPGYAPTFSRPLTRWVEEQRTSIEGSVLRALVARLGALRAAGQWRDLDPIARASLKLDPLNEEATLALAEALALNGQKAAAMQLLDSYLDEVAPFGRAVRLPASVLRVRISERTPDDTFRRARSGAFVGRDAEMAELWRHHKAAAGGVPRAIVIHGAPGIGKTRLATEFLKATALDGAACVKVQCAAHDAQRPLGVFVDLVPKLLAAPGGLGVAPKAMAQLQRLTQPALAPDDAPLDADPRHLFNEILTAIGDLVDAVCEEQPVVVVVDDAHHMDPASADLAFTLVDGGQPRPLLFVLTSRSKLGAGDERRAHDGLSWLRLRPLDQQASRELFLSLAPPSNNRGRAKRAFDRLALAGGNPLYLRSLVLESPGGGELALPASLTDLLSRRVQRLADTTLRAFVAAVLLGKHCRLDRLVRLAGLNEYELLNAIQSLENEGFLEADGSEIRSAHPMLSQAALAQFPPVTMRLMHSAAAMQLQAEAEPGHDIGMLWDAAEHWHRAGATDKAIELLRSCAGYCTNIGRPSVACELLQRTLVIAPTEQQQGILLRLIDAAGLAEAYGLLASAIQQLRHATGTESESTIHDALELVELQAKRLCGTSLVDLETRLADCISHPTADSSHRLRAACFLLVAHDLNLDRHGAALAYRLSQSIPCANDVDRLNRVLADLLFNLLIGERVPAARAAHELLARSEKSDSRAASLRFRIDAAMGLFRAAEAHPAIDAMEQAFEASERNGMLSSMLDSSSMLAWMQHTVGDFAAAARWDRLSDQAFARLSRALVQPGGRTGPYFSNKIEFALERADWPAASAWLQKARSAYAEIDAPRSRQLARAFRMRIEQLQHLAGGPIEDLEELASDHALGRECGLHDNFVDAYWHELVRAGLKNKANDMLVEYVTRYRRDGFSLSAPIREIVRVERLALVAKFQPIDQGSESRGGA